MEGASLKPYWDFSQYLILGFLYFLQVNKPELPLASGDFSMETGRQIVFMVLLMVLLSLSLYLFIYM